MLESCPTGSTDSLTTPLTSDTTADLSSPLSLVKTPMSTGKTGSPTMSVLRTSISAPTFSEI